MADLNGDKISHKGQKRHKYSPDVKKQAIAYAEIHGNRPAARHFQDIYIYIYFIYLYFIDAP